MGKEDRGFVCHSSSSTGEIQRERFAAEKGSRENQMAMKEIEK